MLRSIALRPLGRALPQARPQLKLLNFTSSSGSARCFSKLVRPVVPQLARPTPTRIRNELLRPLSTRLYTVTVKGDKLKEEQAKHRQDKLKSDPEAVSTTSSVRQVFEQDNTSVRRDDEADMLHGIKSDLVRITNRLF